MVLCLAFGAVVVRLVELQVVDGDDYAARGVAQRVRTVTLPAERGSIFDREGTELAMSAPRTTVWADPRLVADPAASAAALAPVLGMDEGALAQQLDRDGAFVYLARQVDEAVAGGVEDLDLEGVELLEEPRRFTPAGDLAASVIGAVDIDNNGVSGLELRYDDRLAGAPGELLLERGPDGSAIPTGEHRLRPPERGEDVVLTIDRALQYEAERALAEQITASGARGGMAVVMDPRTGEILAMANLRAAGPDGSPVPSRDNMAVTAVFEPGSVNKVITLAAVLEEGLLTPTETLTVPDRIDVSVHRYADAERHPPQQWSVTDIATYSSNVGTILLAQRLGRERVDDYLRRFGFGQPTGVDFPGESAGLLLDPEEWDGTSIGSIPIGQGMAVTALQMLDAYNVVANGGVLIEPTLVRGTVDEEGRLRPAPEPRRRRVLSEGTAAQMRRILANVVAEGTGAGATIEGYQVAGKTGTARKPSSTERGYQPGAYVASFAGFAPAERPDLSAIVVLDEPTPYYGGVVSAPVFARVVRSGLWRSQVPPSQPRTPDEPPSPPRPPQTPAPPD